MRKLDGTQRVLVACTLLNTIGNGFFSSAIAVYLAVYRGFDLGTVALILGASNICGMAVQWPIGALSDHVDPRIIMTIGNSLACVLGFISIMLHGQMILGLVLCAFQFVDRGANIARVGLIPKLYNPQSAVNFRNITRAVSFGGLALGGLGAGGLMALSTHGPAWSLAANALLYVPIAVLAWHLPRIVSRPVTSMTPEATQTRGVWRDSSFLLLLGVICISGIMTEILSFLVPAYLVKTLGGPVWLTSVVVTVTTATSVGLQVPVGRHATSVGTSARYVATGTMVCLAGLTPMLFATIFPRQWSLIGICASAAVLTSVGTVMWNAGQFGLVMPLANPVRQGEYQGLVGSAESIIAAITPWLVVQAMGLHSIGWAVLIVIIVSCGAAVPRAARWHQKTAIYSRNEENRTAWRDGA